MVLVATRNKVLAAENKILDEVRSGNEFAGMYRSLKNYIDSSFGILDNLIA